jgi:protein SCO1
LESLSREEKECSLRHITIFFSLLLLLSLLLIQFIPEKEELPILKSVTPFEMSNVHNQSSYRLEKGKVKLVTFFYTNCPDVCPSTMSDLKTLQEKLKKADMFASHVELISISIDPEVDDEQTIKLYAKAFQADPAGWKWLRDSLDNTRAVADKFQMNYKKGEDGFFAHNTTMYLVDQKNQIRAVYEMANTSKNIDVETILKDMKHLSQKD